MFRALLLLCIAFLMTDGLSAERPDLNVEVLTPVNTAPGEPGLRVLKVRFTYTGSKTLFILAPLDGSAYGLLAPFYRFTIRGDDGQTVRLGGMDNINGLWDGTAWPDDYLIPLRSGHAHELIVLVPIIRGHNGKLPSSGTIDFEYSMPENPRSTRNSVTYPDRNLVYPVKVWRGTATAKQIRFGPSATR